MAAGKTLKSILIKLRRRLSLDIQEPRDLMAEDELELDTLGDRKSVRCLSSSQMQTQHLHLVAALMYSLLFNLLCDKADDFYTGTPAGPCAVPAGRVCEHRSNPLNFDKLIATIRSREISAYYFAVVKPVKDHLQGRGGYHRG